MKKINVLMTVLAVAFMSLQVNAQSYDDVVDKYNAAAELVSGKKYVEAIPALEEVVKLGQEVGGDANEIVTNAQKLIPACYLRIGGAYAQQQNWDMAIENLEKAAELGELYGDVASIRNANGMISKVYTASAAEAFNGKDYAKAIEIFSKGYAANPTDTDLALNLAMSYGELGDIENAAKIYNEIIALEERHSKYKEPAATAREKLGYYMTIDVQKAIENKDMNKAYELMEGILASEPNNAIVGMMMLQVAGNNKQWDRIIAYGEKAAEAQETPELKSNAYYLLGAAYQNKNNNAKAVENYKKVTAGDNVANAKTQIAALNK